MLVICQLATNPVEVFSTFGWILPAHHHQTLSIFTKFHQILQKFTCPPPNANDGPLVPPLPYLVVFIITINFKSSGWELLTARTCLHPWAASRIASPSCSILHTDSPCHFYCLNIWLNVRSSGTCWSDIPRTHCICKNLRATNLPGFKLVFLSELMSSYIRTWRNVWKREDFVSKQVSKLCVWRQQKSKRTESQTLVSFFMDKLMYFRYVELL